METVLITGAAGFIGGSLVNAFCKGHKVVACVHTKQVRYPDNVIVEQLDLTSANSVQLLARHKPGIIIHAASYKDIPKCQDQPQMSKDNVTMTKNLLELAKTVSGFFVFISSDQIFDGNKLLHTEDEHASPINAYGRSKLDSEVLIRNSGVSYAICRTSGVYGWGGNSLAEFILEKLESNEEVDLMDDQFLSPTYIGQLMGMITEICTRKKVGVFHTAGSQRTTRYDFGVVIASVFEKPVTALRRCALNDRTDASYRPTDTSLDIRKTQENLETEFFNLVDGVSALRLTRPL